MNETTRSVLLALGAEPLAVSDIARRARLPEAQTRTALEELVQLSIAIPEDGQFELTGPLSWFGSFANAVRYHAGRRFIVGINDEAQSHLYLCDVRVKGKYAAGDPRNETVAVFACGLVAPNAVRPTEFSAPTCRDCLSAMGEHVRTH